MTWVIGDLVTLDSSGNITGGSGARLALFESRKGEMPKPSTYPPLLDPNKPPPPIEDPETQSVVPGWNEELGSWADFANKTNTSIFESWAKNLTKLAAECNNTAQGIIAFALSNIEVAVTVHKFVDVNNLGDYGLQRLPTDLVENEPTKAPIEDKVLRGGIQ